LFCRTTPTGSHAKGISWPEPGEICTAGDGASPDSEGVIEKRDSDGPQRDEELAAELSALVHRSLLQLGDMKVVQEGVKKISERLSKITRPPKEHPPETGHDVP